MRVLVRSDVGTHSGVLARFDDETWDRTLIYNYPDRTERDLAWVAVHTQHEVHHHLADVRAQTVEMTG